MSKLLGKCGCEMCQKGKTSHNDSSHDQSLDQNIQIGSLLTPIHIIGGTTKCARIMCEYFNNNKNKLIKNNNNIIIELGTGTSLVSITLAKLYSTQIKQIIATDQQPMLDISNYNINNNQLNQDLIITKPLLWGNKQHIDDLKLDQLDYIIGSDLIFAHENNPALVQTFYSLCCKYPNCICYLASIERFNWEKDFFKLLKQHFKYVEKIFSKDEIDIYKFTLGERQIFQAREGEG